MWFILVLGRAITAAADPAEAAQAIAAESHRPSDRDRPIVDRSRRSAGFDNLRARSVLSSDDRKPRDSIGTETLSLGRQTGVIIEAHHRDAHQFCVTVVLGRDRTPADTAETTLRIGKGVVPDRLSAWTGTLEPFAREVDPRHYWATGQSLTVGQLQRCGNESPPVDWYLMLPLLCTMQVDSPSAAASPIVGLPTTADAPRNLFQICHAWLINGAG